MTEPRPLSLFVDRIAIIDSAVLCPERGLHGDTWLLDLTLAGDPTEPGMVLDFGRLKPAVKRLVDARFDHVLLVPTRAPGLVVEGEDPVTVRWTDREGRPWVHRAPRSAYEFVDAERIDAASLEQAIAAMLAEALQAEGLAQGQTVALTLRREAIDGAWYRYAHGLKHHAGKCQRIAHGHRSRIEIRLDGVRSAEAEAAWGERWDDIYLGTREDLAETADGRHRFAYRSREGAFELTLPVDRCELFETESTVENIAVFIAEEVQRQYPGAVVEVRAYEGVDKGGIARA